MDAPSLFSKRPSSKTNPTTSPSRRSLLFYLRLFSVWLSISGFRWGLIAVIALAWYVRARNPHFSSAYMDESIYVLYGRMFLSRHFEAPIDQPLHFSFGWYLWPILAAWADRIHGLVGVRELAAAMGTAIVCSVYAFARRLFSPAVGLASAAVFALLGPAVIVSRVATRDTGSLCFFAAGLWLFIKAWQEEKWPAWLGASLCFFAAFLCKFLVAIYFPFVVILTLWKGRRALLAFSAPLTLFCAGYAFYYRTANLALLRYAQAYGSLRAPASAAWQIYFAHRLDFWILVLLSGFALVRRKRDSQWTGFLLLAGAAIIPIFQLASRADYDYWKHVNYSFLFLVPLAMQGLLLLVRRAAPASYALSGTLIVGLFAVAFGWTGNAWRIDRFLFWPNVGPVVAYFQGRIAPSDRVLVDDTVFRYYLSPPLHQWQIVDPFYFRYDAETGPPAYAAATRDGSFDYMILDGGIGDDAKRLQRAISPALSGRYVLKMSMPDPVLGQEIEIYERQTPPAVVLSSLGPEIQITNPPNGARLSTSNKAATLTALVRGAQPGDYALADVFTNRWYTQGGKIILRTSDSTLRQTIYLAGEGRQQCYHVVRIRLFDPRGHFLSQAMNFDIARLNPDGTLPCH